MNAARLHYIYDPLCGWCYGAAPLVRAAQALISIQLHAGGMMTGARRQFVTAQLRDFVRRHDAHIAKLSGQTFGSGYTHGLLENTQTLFDSEVPSAAIIAVEQLSTQPDAGLAMLSALQQAHYVEDQRIADIDTVCEIAANLGYEPSSVKERMKLLMSKELGGSTCEAHFKQTHRLMQQLGVQGFPSMAIEHNGVFRKLDVGSYIGKPEAFSAHVQLILADISMQESRSEAKPTLTGERAVLCSVDACEIER